MILHIINAIFNMFNLPKLTRTINTISHESIGLGPIIYVRTTSASPSSAFIFNIQSYYYWLYSMNVNVP